tara:strand:- start:90 stop:560 length:471 start_codon:yes stop_codon:yes gene_type:complete
MRILVMGLSGSGKSYLSERLQKHLNCVWINADTIRKMTSDWDFSYEGRIRQAKRMKYYSDFELDFNKNIVICDFICAIEDMRTILKPDYVIWMDTVKSSKYKDTDNVFEPPSLIDSRIDHFLNDKEIELEAKKITKLLSSLMLEYEDGVRPLTMDI